MKKWFSAYALTFSRYLDYRGRSARREIWNFVINTLIIDFVILLFAGKMPVAVFHIVAMIVLAALAARRFHDIGLSGWYVIALIVPVVNLCAFFVLLFFKSVPGENRYGPRPAQAD